MKLGLPPQAELWATTLCSPSGLPWAACLSIAMVSCRETAPAEQLWELMQPFRSTVHDYWPQRRGGCTWTPESDRLHGFCRTTAMGGRPGKGDCVIYVWYVQGWWWWTSVVLFFDQKPGMRRKDLKADLRNTIPGTFQPLFTTFPANMTAHINWSCYTDTHRQSLRSCSVETSHRRQWAFEATGAAKSGSSCLGFRWLRNFCPHQSVWAKSLPLDVWTVLTNAAGEQWDLRKDQTSLPLHLLHTS